MSGGHLPNSNRVIIDSWPRCRPTLQDSFMRGQQTPSSGHVRSDGTLCSHKNRVRKQRLGECWDSRTTRDSSSWERPLSRNAPAVLRKDTTGRSARTLPLPCAPPIRGYVPTQSNSSPPLSTYLRSCRRPAIRSTLRSSRRALGPMSSSNSGNSFSETSPSEAFPRILGTKE